MAGVVHIAGLAITIGPLYRQRCSWCGALLRDGDKSQEMSPAGAKPPDKWYWDADTLIEVTKDGNCTSYVVLPFPANGKLPLNACDKVAVTKESN